VSLILAVVELSETEGRRVVELPLWGFIVLVAVLAFSLLLLFSMRKRNTPRVTRMEGIGIEAALPSIVHATHGVLSEGNRIELFENGEWFDSVLDDIAAARESVHFETFLWKPGKLEDRFVEAFSSRARAGVAVRLHLDGMGGRRIEKKNLKKLREAGCNVAFYHPPRLSRISEINNRTHRKVVVIDGRIGHVGGHCIVDEWLGDARNGEEFRDVSARVTGPVVAKMQGCFVEHWVEETGEVPAGPELFPQLDETGESPAHLTYVTPSGSHSDIELLHYLVIRAAREQILIQNPYFLPQKQAVVELELAVQRGVDVRVMLPSSDASDNPIVQHASHHYFGDMLKKGIRIFEYQPTLLHQKTMVVDHEWSSIGSANFDARSFELNDEVTLGIRDRKIAAQLEEIFEKDLQHCTEATVEQWKKRGLRHRAIDGFSYLFNEQL
jgi:cardiolipin synthase A/B